MDKKIEIRYAKREDTALILSFIKDLAEYENMLGEVVADENLIEEWIFDNKSKIGTGRNSP